MQSEPTKKDYIEFAKSKLQAAAVYNGSDDPNTLCVGFWFGGEGADDYIKLHVTREEAFAARAKRLEVTDAMVWAWSKEVHFF